LIGIVSVKRIRVIDLVRLWPKRDLLVLDRQQLGRVMDCAVAIVVVANRPIEHVVAEDAVECFNLRGRRFG
jgi:hypothetical protein